MPKTRSWTMLLVLGLLLGFTWSCAAAQDVPRLDKVTLKAWLSDPQVIIVDVRTAKDWDGSTKKIKGAVRQDPKDFDPNTLPKGKKIVLYCA